MFPAPGEITMRCSCLDWAQMCKHIAAVLYGVGARLDEQPEIFFTLRRVDQLDLVTAASAAGLTRPARAKSKPGKKVIARGDLSALFGIELDDTEAAPKRDGEPKAKAKAKAGRPRKSPPAAARTRAP
jgi:uncharacterized Zn finger protein